MFSLEMNMINSAVQQVNLLSKENIPFFIMVDFELQKPIIIPLSLINSEELLICFEQYSNAAQNKCTDALKIESVAQTSGCNKEMYSKAFDLVMNHLLRGDTYLINLTFPVPIHLSVSLSQLYDLSKAKYKILLKDRLLVFSPETFIKINNGTISAFPMKGTIDASIENATELLLEDKKELAEHFTIVDLLRNDLSLVAKEVRVKKFRYIDHIHTNNKHLLQTSSEISGKLPETWKNHLGDIIFSLLPAGSVSGAPKKRTCEIIREAEGIDRGYYTGIAGVFDGNTFDSCVLIRFIEQTPDGFRYRAGGGITSQSKCESEFQELLDKVYVPLV